jgi:outer membrane receptor for ferrienterochelin and colicins
MRNGLLFITSIFLLSILTAEPVEDTVIIVIDENDEMVIVDEEDGEIIVVDKEEEIVVKGRRREIETHLAGEKVTVVTEDSIKESGAVSLSDIMSRETGIQVNQQAYSNRGSPQGIQIQGCDPARVLILVDGRRIIGDMDGIIDASQLPLDNVEKIIIIKGSSSAVYGSDAICGVVNIITKGFKYGTNFRGKAEYGSYHSRQFSTGLRHRSDSRWALRADASYYGTEGYDLDKSNSGTDGDAVNTVKAATGVLWEPSSSWRLYLDNDFNYDSRARYASFTKGNNPREYVSLLDREIYRAGGIFSTRYSFDEINMIELRVDNTYFRRESVDDLRGSPEMSKRVTDNNMLNLLFEGKFLAGTWNLFHFGAVFDYEWLNDTRSAKKVVSEEELSFEESSNVDGKTVWNTALFIQDEMIPFDWWTIIPGIRFSYNPNFSYFFTPKLAMKFDLHDRVSLSSSYGMGHRTPTLKHLYYTFEHTVFGNIIGVNGNPDLKPEKSHSVNLGMDVVPYGEESLLSLNGYFNHYENFIDINYDNPEWVGADQYYTYSNIAKARTYGLESRAVLPFLDYFQISAGYALLFAENIDKKNTLPFRPKHQVQSSLRFSHKEYGITAVVSGSYQSSVFTDSDNLYLSSQFFLLNAYLEKSFKEWFRIYVRGSNITNVKRMPADPKDMRPQPGMEFFGGISWDYTWNERGK